MNIILISADTLKAKTLETEKNNIPNIEFLRKNGFEFKNHYVSSPWTGASFASFFTGVYPKEHGFILNCPKLKNVSKLSFAKKNKPVFFQAFKHNCENYFTKILRKSHYCIGIQGNEMCYKDSFGKYFHEYLIFFQNPNLMKKIFLFSKKIKLFSFLMKIKKIKDKLLLKLFNKKKIEWASSIPANTLVNNAVKKIKANKNKDFFLWINFMDMHTPYLDLYNLSNKSEYKTINITKSELLDLRYNLKNKLSETEKKFVIEKYNSSIRAIDKQIGKIINCLKKNSLFDKTTIIFTSDHGEEFWEHGTQRDDIYFYNRGIDHGHTVYNELIKVPLFLFNSSFGSKKINKLSSSVNFYNTVFELAGIKKDSELPVSLMDIALNKKEMDYVIAECLLLGKETKTIIDKKNFKLIKGTENSRLELYDLNTDPDEKKDISKENPKKVQELMDKLYFHI